MQDDNQIIDNDKPGKFPIFSFLGFISGLYSVLSGIMPFATKSQVLNSFFVSSYIKQSMIVCLVLFFISWFMREFGKENSTNSKIIKYCIFVLFILFTLAVPFIYYIIIFSRQWFGNPH
jgi:hypothetical protein